MSQLKKRSTCLGVLAAVIGGMAFAPVASAHTLSKAQAEERARAWAEQTARYGNNPYTFGTAVCDPRGLPHRRGCTVQYHTADTWGTGQWACEQRIQIWYAAHNAGDPAPNYARFATAKDANGKYFTHPC
jgi:hypothetical protein